MGGERVVSRRLMLNNGNGAAPILPKAYKRVEWIENTDKDYIATNIFPFKTTVIIDFQYTVNPGATVNTMFGCWNKNNRFYGFRQFNNYFWASTRSNTNIRIRPFDLNRHVGVFNDENGVCSIDTDETAPSADYDLTAVAAYPLYIFGTNDAGPNVANAKCRIYAIRFIDKQTNINIGNFIPCYRKSDGEIGMYDTVTDTFYTNAGTGTFTKGADIN